MLTRLIVLSFSEFALEFQDRHLGEGDSLMPQGVDSILALDRKFLSWSSGVTRPINEGFGTRPLG